MSVIKVTEELAKETIKMDELTEEKNQIIRDVIREFCPDNHEKVIQEIRNRQIKAIKSKS